MTVNVGIRPRRSFVQRGVELASHKRTKTGGELLFIFFFTMYSFIIFVFLRKA